MPVDRPPARVTLPEVTGPTLDAELAAHPAVVVHFWAVWNGHDTTMNRHLEAIRARFAGRAAFFSCNIDREENWELCYGLRILNLPWLVVYVAGVPQMSLCGCRDPETLAVEIEARLAGVRPVPKPRWFDRLLRRWFGASGNWFYPPPRQAPAHDGPWDRRPSEKMN